MTERLARYQPRDYRPPSVPRDTSIAAADSMRPHGKRVQSQVYDYIASCGQDGATEREIGAALNLGGDTVRPRVWELINEGKIIDSGARRKTPSGRAARVLVTV